MRVKGHQLDEDDYYDHEEDYWEEEGTWEDAYDESVAGKPKVCCTLAVCRCVVFAEDGHATPANVIACI